MTKRLVAHKVRTPSWCTVTVTEENLEQLMEETKLPVVVKPIASGSSIGVTIAHTKDDLRRGLEESIRLGGRTVLEQYVKGREIQVAVLNGKALPPLRSFLRPISTTTPTSTSPAPPGRYAPLRSPPSGRRR